jgi:large subunit ribosomal protein L10
VGTPTTPWSRTRWPSWPPTRRASNGFDDLLTGPTAIAFINGDVVEAAKGLRDFAKANPTLVIKGGVLDGKPLDAKEVAKLADLESREVLLGKLAGAMLASLSQAVYLLNAPLAQVARLAGALRRGRAGPLDPRGVVRYAGPGRRRGKQVRAMSPSPRRTESADEADGHVGTEDSSAESTESEDPTEA